MSSSSSSSLFQSSSTSSAASDSTSASASSVAETPRVLAALDIYRGNAAMRPRRRWGFVLSSTPSSSVGNGDLPGTQTALQHDMQMDFVAWAASKFGGMIDPAARQKSMLRCTTKFQFRGEQRYESMHEIVEILAKIAITSISSTRRTIRYLIAT